MLSFAEVSPGGAGQVIPARAQTSALATTRLHSHFWILPRFDSDFIALRLNEFGGRVAVLSPLAVLLSPTLAIRFICIDFFVRIADAKRLMLQE